MDNCEKIRDLILTDYVDAEADEKIKEQVNFHLLACPDCRSFVKEVESDLTVPFKEAAREEVPVHLWAAIKERIESESRPIAEPERTESPVGRWLRALSFPRLAPALMGVALLVLVWSAITPDGVINQAKEDDEQEYLVYLLDSMDASQDTEDVFSPNETPIETYFL